jgi:sulfite reductase beta subunit-like hemoprotein
MLSVTGCPNSCAQHQIADIGLMGVVSNFRGERGTEAFNSLFGGALDGDAKFATLTLKQGSGGPRSQIHQATRRSVQGAPCQCQRVLPTVRRTPPPIHLAVWLTIPETAEVI